MILLVPTAAVALLAHFFSSHIQRHRAAWYLAACAVAVLTTIFVAMEQINGTTVQGVAGLLQRVSFSGYLSFAFFLVVMFAGALNTGWKVTQNWMRIRAQLSIIGSILILPHALLYLIHILPSLSFFMTMRGKDLALSLGYLLAGVAAFVVMLPLFVTSFKKIRQKMKAVRWKKLQKWAYLFYALIYAHVVLAILLAAEVDWFRLAAYTAIFAAYLVFKKIKYASGSIKGKMADKPIPAAKAGGPSGAARV